ncbi:serpin-ZXA-like [Bidens hawaiensis]|uniref:serpin-ZXA-like n=1 Tax=Bidens hawaiensis TaxID=980011 RepID=UPI004049DD07
MNASYIKDWLALPSGVAVLEDAISSYHEATKRFDDVVYKHQPDQSFSQIKNVLPANSADESTRLILANAVYFKGAWTQKFDQSKTKESDFHLLNGNKVRVPFMTNKEKQYVHEFNDFKVLGLPYFQGKDERRFTMYFFLPDAKDGLQSLIEKIGSTSKFFKRHIPHKKVQLSQFLIPKFKIEFGFEASDMLKELGLVLPFSYSLTEMVDSEQVYVSKILHKSFVEVNEKGTEAAAVTVTMFVGCSLQKVKRPKKVDFVADHPFLFVIQEDVSGVVLFTGQVINPSVH